MKNTLQSGKSYEYEQSFCTNPDNVGRFDMYQMGEVTCEPGYVCDTHLQWCFEITLVISGNGIHTVNGVDREVKEGDLFLTPLHSYHKITAVTRFRYVFIGFGFHKTDTEELSMLQSFFQSSPTEILRGNRKIISLFNNCFDEYSENQICGKLVIESLISAIVTNVMRLYLVKGKRQPETPEKKEQVGISIYAVRTYIDGNIGNLTEIKDIAKRLNYSPVYLSHCFKSQMGITLRQYIAQKRIEESIHLVSDLGISITKAGVMAGFATSQSFSKAFKRIKGVSPKDFFKNQ